MFTAVAGSAVMSAFGPLAVAHGVPVVGPWTGYPPLRTNFHREIINIRGNYLDETVVMAAFLVEPKALLGTIMKVSWDSDVSN